MLFSLLPRSLLLRLCLQYLRLHLSFFSTSLAFLVRSEIMVEIFKDYPTSVVENSIKIL
jgi:hypothetical protein